jgi:regulator of nonsense transcripts 2
VVGSLRAPVSVTQLTADKDLLPTSVPLAVAFSKHLALLYLPQVSADAQDPTPAEAVNGERDAISASVKDKCRKLLVAYYEALGKRAVKDHLVR